MCRFGLALATSVISFSAAQASESISSFQWPENPFAWTFSDDLFLEKEEPRFERASRVFSESMSGIGGDVSGIASYPFHAPQEFGTYALGIGALVLMDRPLTEFYQDTIVPAVEDFDLPKKPDWTPSWLTTDEFYVGAAVAGTYAYGVMANDERSQVAALLASKAIAYSYVTSHVLLKAGFGRLRPVPNLSSHTGDPGEYTTSPYDWFEDNSVTFGSTTSGTAMPSYHFTMYFATARVYSGVYDNYFIPYATAAAIALSSAEEHNHWVSDMVAGALIGTGIGNMVLRNYEGRKKKIGHLVPVVTSESLGLTYQLTF